jgi:hypothetical protein
MVFQEEQLRERILKLIHHEDFTQKKFAEKINSIHQKNLEKFLVDASENIGINIDKTQYNVI